MKAVLLPLALLAASVSAQTSSACGADYIVEACLGTINGQLAQCGSTDYQCQCNGYKNLLVCYDNCPNDTRVPEAQHQMTIFCQYASQFPSTSSSAFSAKETTSTPVDATTTTDAAATGGSASSTTSTGSAAQASKTNSAADLALNAGGVLAAVAGVVAAVL